jgi:peptidylprolyl isomerase/FKBP-type peptidyl-prolyl cis-trans isomerase FklB
MRRPAIVAALACLLMLGACQPSGQKAKANADAGAAFLATNAKAAGVVTLPDGLQYKVLQSGPAGGIKPHVGDDIKVNYEGKLITGKVFDSSYERGAPMAGPLKRLIPGWIEILQKMKPGDVWEIYVPAKLGYGDEESGDIPAGSVLIFKIELIDVLPSSDNIGAG